MNHRSILMNKFILFLLFTWIVVIVVVAYPQFAHSQGIVCAERQRILTGLENRFGERVAEQGVDNGLLVTVTVSVTGNWSFLVTPKNKLNTFCVAATGTNWTQDKTGSKGISASGSILSIVYKENGKWELMYTDNVTGEKKSVTTGYGWERIIDLNKFKQTDLNKLSH